MDIKNQNITQILSNSLSGDLNTRTEAEKTLSLLASSNYPEFLHCLAIELSDESKPTKNRQMAASYFKNSLLYNLAFQDIWKNLDNEKKTQIKQCVLGTLATSIKEVRTAAGVVVANLAKIETPLQKNWPELISTLCSVTSHENPNLRLSAIESLGFICEELTNKTIDSASVDLILTALITTIKQNSADNEIAKYILKALYHCIKLAEKNFSKKVIYFINFLGRISCYHGNNNFYRISSFYK
jgi:importin subunit beta-1